MNRRDMLQYTAAALAAAQTLPAAQAVLPKLPYAVDALEPHIDARTMEIHHTKHHQAYIDNLNKALATQPSLAATPLDHLLKDLAAVPESFRTAVRNHGGGHWNHSLFWQSLAPAKSARPKGKLESAIRNSFGGQSALEDGIRAKGLTVFGSGWLWLTARNGRLSLETSPNQDSPLMTGGTPILGIDVWEHAYYLKYQNRRADYLAAILNVIHWDFVAQTFEQL